MSNGNLDSLLHGACVFPLPPLSQFLSSWLVFFAQSLSLLFFTSMKKKIVDHVCFSSTTSLPISLFIVFFYEEEACRSCGFFLHHLSLNFSLFIVVFYKEEACGSCVFSLHYLCLNLFLHRCFLQRRKVANHVYFLSTISYSISLSLFLVFYEEVCISSMFYLRHLALKIESLFIFCFLWRRSLIYHVCFSHMLLSHLMSSWYVFPWPSLSQPSFNLFLFVFYEEESWGSYVFALKSLSHISHTHLIMLCVFPPPSLSQLEISSLFGFLKKELLDYVCFCHTISFNTILLAIKSMPF